MPNIATLILAAGASRRLGRPKQLLKIGGQTLLRRTAKLALSLGVGPVAVVLGAQAAQLREELTDLEVALVDNPNWAEGMSTSLRAGLLFLESLEPNVDAALILLVDQPRVDADLLRQLVRIFQEKQPPMVASFYNEMNGVPAIFSRPLFEELKSVAGDRGARRVIRLHEHDLIAVDFPGGAEDIDTEEDVDLWRKNGQ